MDPMRAGNRYTKILGTLAVIAAVWGLGDIVLEQIQWDPIEDAVGGVLSGGPKNRGELLTAELGYPLSWAAYVLTLLWLATKAVVASVHTQQAPAATQRAE